ncbi:FeS cluster assembly protein sufD [Candidatus Ornithobacterium hominis]|uniref:FeS cluster assembly protein sufD n=1 Tax=Candidatus Ornithobacterium hominis TaxID=2497989 RepID=A0A383TUU9_9FLAO|nr:Fe-S cluster assembly protein SufD [Candidatus Ornithobacterium hominis]MCT7904545.1 Fe-S cluster assembly protein SufD [Candidatus Ornithobacterium hominis]SZD71442.1 FeS cluster assembly protein sufD [Candidatus Ornithobacterium hominis]
MADLKNQIENYFKTNFQSDSLSIQREKYFEKFLSQGFPTPKLEEWKYTSMRKWWSQEYELAKVDEMKANEQIKKIVKDSQLSGSKLVFINGVFSEEISEIQRGLNILFLQNQPKLPEKFGQILKEDEALVNLNAALATQGYLISVEKASKLNPVEIFHFYESEKPIFLNLRNFIEIKKSQELALIETHISLSSQPNFIHQLTEVDLEENAKLDVYKIQNDEKGSALVDSVFCNQQRDSLAKVHTFSMAGEMIRNNLNFRQNGENCNSVMQAITLGKEQQHVDHHTLVEHTAPNCESHELYRTILDDESTGVFNGKIIVDANAQKIDAFQQNNNILLSPKASVDTKPQLEIFADDVKCSHGCTVGQLDRDALFYMESRGIPKKEAQAYLLFAFCSDVLSEVEYEPLKNHISAILAKKLNVEMDFH